jgi:hypothetical protein
MALFERGRSRLYWPAMTTPDIDENPRRNGAWWIPLFGACCGAAIWVAITLATGKREAWDSELYFTVGLPLTYAVSFLLGIVARRQWAWAGVAPFSGQFLALLGMAGVGNLLPLGLFLFAILSLPGVLAAWIGAWAGRRYARIEAERNDPS